MRRILLATLLALGPVLLGATPAVACHPGPPYLGCPHGCPPVCDGGRHDDHDDRHHH